MAKLSNSTQLMLRGSFAGHSPGMQFLMIIFLAVLGITVFSLLGVLLIPIIYSVSFSDLLSASQNGESFSPQVLKFLQGLSSIGLFLVPALMAAYLFSLKSARYLRIDRFPKKWLPVMVLLVIITLSGNVISDLLYRISKSMPWPESLAFLEKMITASESSMTKQIQEFLVMNTPYDFVQMFFIMAVLPAVCEEAMFRGALQPVLIKLTKNTHFGIIFTALLFGLMHMQFYTFLSIFILGLVLGYVRQWTDSLWPAMVIHLINNGSIVIAVYFYNIDYLSANDVSEAWDWKLSVPGLLVFTTAMVILYKLMTPKKESPIREDEA